MSAKQLRKALYLLVAVLFGLCISLYFGGFHEPVGSNRQIQFASAKSVTGVLAPGETIQQRFYATEQELISLAVHMSLSAGMPDMSFSLTQGGAELLSGSISSTDAEGYAELVDAPLAITPNEMITLDITARTGNAAGLFWGDSVNLIRGETPLTGLTDETALRLNGVALQGMLSARGMSRTMKDARLPYLIITAALVLFGAAWALAEYRCFLKGRSTQGLRLINAMYRYWFVMSQMIERDFKAKYKRSILGVLWSFLNPLLTMTVQYIVFSTLFRSNIAYFPVYLMSGIVCFSFFGEATSVGLSSITGNASLLTKVYVPKYIFPVSRVLSSGINFLFSLIPLFAMTFISGLPITRAYLMLPFTFLCLLVMVLGFALLLASLMVFFRDIQFLWSIVTTLLTYMTPIFYPESILPEQLLFLIKFNPLYHVLRLLRSILIDGIAPEPKAFLLCVLACGVPCLLGALFFKKKQDLFIMRL